MNTDFDKEFDKMMTEEKEIPRHVRKRLDNTYSMIQVQTKKKKNKSVWMRVAACMLLITGAILTNEQVRASINDFFSFEDKGIERAVSEGFLEENNSSASDQNINITLKQNFADANKIGMSFQLEFEDLTVLENGVTQVTMDYRLKNGDGEYIEEFIPDTKPLKGKGGYISGLTHNNPILDAKTGIVQYDVVLDSSKGIIPDLKAAVVEIESINIYPDYDYRELQEELGEEFDVSVTIIDGQWDLALVNQDESKLTSIFEYVMKNSSSDIEVISATASPTSLNITLIVDEEAFGSEGQFMKLIDEKGAEYGIDGFHMETEKNKTTVDVNFSISSHHNADKLTLIIDNIGEVKLIKK